VLLKGNGFLCKDFDVFHFILIFKRITQILISLCKSVKFLCFIFIYFIFVQIASSFCNMLWWPIRIFLNSSGQAIETVI
jgi:hypothetical protein